METLFLRLLCGIGGFVDAGANGAGGTTAGFGPVGQGGILILNANGTLKLLIRGWDTYDGLYTAIQDGFSDGYYSTPALADLDNDGRLDFVIGGTDQNLHVLKMVHKDTSKNSTGKTIRFFHPPGKDGIWAVPIYEFDDDGDGKFNEDPVGDMTSITFYNTSDDVSGYPGIDDDGDGLIDEGAPGDDDEDSSSQIGYVYWDRVDEDEFEWPFRNVDSIVSSPALADIDGDGTPDIVIGADSAGGSPLKSERKPIAPGGALRVLNMFAQEIGTFPQWIEQVVWSPPSVVDIDHDGNKEIFVGTGPVYTDGAGWTGKGLYAFNKDGTSYLSSTYPHYGLFASTQEIIFGAPTFGDINGDGELEIVAADFAGYLYAWNSSGSLLPGFPMLPLQEFAAIIGADPHAQIRSSPILVDVNNDGKPEIIIGVGWSIVAVKGDGTLVPEFRYGHTNFTTGTSPVFATPAAADLDNNGKIDLIWVTGASSDGGLTITNGIIHIWELGPFNKLANPWPMFKRTGTRTSAYTIQFENPIFTPTISKTKAGDLLTVSVNVYPGISQISSVEFEIEINGTPVETNLVDNGTNGDALANDGRYTATITLPNQINTIGNLSFTAQDNSGESVTSKVETHFTHINVMNLVTKYYNDVLDRLPEPGGAEGWAAEIERMISIGIDVKEGFQALAKQFFNCEEYLNKNKANDAFVTDLYQTFLNRAPDPAGMTFWLNYLSQGLTKDMLITQFAYSDEFSAYIEGVLGSGTRRPENNLVNDLYRGFLGRFPDTAGFNSWLGLMRNAQCTGAQAVRDLTYQIALGFVQSTEYGLRNRNNSQYVEDLYNGILRRGADPAGFIVWVNALNTTTRSQMVKSFADSLEFQLRVQEVINAGCFQ